MKNGIATLATLLLLIACRPAPAGSYSYQHTDVEGWESTDTLHFPIDTIRESGVYQLEIALRTTEVTPYPFRSLTLQLCQEWSNGTARDWRLTLPMDAPDRGGVETGVAYVPHIVKAGQLHLKAGTSGRLAITHSMHTRLLQDISDVGIRLRRLP